MGFLRRLLGGDTPEGRSGDGDDTTGSGTPGPEDEATHDRELLRQEAERLQGELLQRQLRYADRSWTPPPQGGTRRAGDPEGPDDA